MSRIVKRETRETVVEGDAFSETRTTVYEGRLTGEQFRELVLEGLRRSEIPSLAYEGLALELTIGSTCLATVMPDVDFTVTQDDLWWRSKRED